MKSTMRFTQEQIDFAKTNSIVGYLKSRNIEPVNLIGGELVYLSPLRSENTPSFYVNPKKNIFNDFGGPEEMKGDSIRLVQQLQNLSFVNAIKFLLESSFESAVSFSFSGPIEIDGHESRIKLKAVQDLKNKSLIRYITNRGVMLKHAFKYLKEIHYEVEQKAYYAVGFQNDSGGYELRNGAGFKGKTENSITTLDRQTDSISLFEGMFDFLSALRYYNRAEPSHTAIILNTTSNFKLLLPKLLNCQTINCYLDNDQAGKNVVNKLVKCGYNVKDWSSIIYPDCKDFNDFVIKRHNYSI